MRSMFLRSISRKQIGVIYSNWKRGNLTLTEEQVKRLYGEFAEQRGYSQDFPQLADRLDRIASAIDAIFANDFKEAQETLDFVLN